MSMLAERKRKPKWCLNPRGSLWVEEKNKFGKRLMEKMGWKDGKGLGPNEDGAIEHVKVSYKNDSKGMGFKENGEQWTEHEDQFTTLLKSLNPDAAVSEEKPATSGKSLEEKSQKSRSRVHYHKFTRGKDLSRYSEKDLANIFGKKSLKPAKASLEESSNPEAETQGKNKFGVETVEKGSMVDYFRQKLPHFSMKGSYEIGSNGVLKSTKSESDSESDNKCGFGFSPKPNVQSSSSFVSYLEAEEGEEKKMKKKKRKIVDETTTADENAHPHERKKKMKFDANSTEEDSNGDGGFVNPTFDPLSRNKIVVVKHSLTTIAEEQVEEDEEEEHTSIAAESKETPKLTQKMKSKKRKEVQRTMEPHCDDEEGQENCCFTDYVVANQSSALAAENNRVDVSSLSNPYEVKRKTKQKKPKLTQADGDNCCFTDEAIEEKSSCTLQDEAGVSSLSNPYEVKRKTKQKKQKLTQEDGDNCCFTNEAIEEEGSRTLQDEAGVSCLPNPYEVKRKTKQKRQKLTQDDDDTCCFTNEAIEGESSRSLQDEAGVSSAPNPYEIKRKTKGKKFCKTIEEGETTEGTECETIKEGETTEGDGDSNCCFTNEAVDLEDTLDVSSASNPYEIKRKSSKKKKSKENATADEDAVAEVSYEVKRNKSKKKSTDVEGDLNLEKDKCDEKRNDGEENSENSNSDGVDAKKDKKKRKSKKSTRQERGLDNPTLNLSSESEGGETRSTSPEGTCETEDAANKSKKRKEAEGSATNMLEETPKKKKSVRFSAVTEERIIRNVLDEGLDNAAFDLATNVADEGARNLQAALDDFQSELENDINERKVQEGASRPDWLRNLPAEEDQSKFKAKKAPEAFRIDAPTKEDIEGEEGVVLKYSEAKLRKYTTRYRSDNTSAKKTYKHLIKTDFLVQFKGTNFHCIEGYASTVKRTV